MTDGQVRRGLDRLGWLELTGTGIWFGGVLALQVAQLVSVTRDEAAPGTTAWITATAAGTVVSVLAMLLVAREWRKHGGRALQRLGRRVWMSGRLPGNLRTRVAVLRDLERREQKLERAGIPVSAFALFWTALAVWHLASQPAPSEAAAWLAVWSLFLTMGITDVVDRRMRPRLQQVIADLRQDPVPPVHPELINLRQPPSPAWTPSPKGRKSGCALMSTQPQAALRPAARTEQTSQLPVGKTPHPTT